MYRNILVPLDGSDFAAAVLPVVRRYADADATVHLLHVLAPGVPADPWIGVSVAGPSPEERVGAAEADLAERANALDGVRTATLVRIGDLGPTVAEVALELGADLIAATTHGRGGLERLWLGSGATAIVHVAPAPVLLHRPVGDGDQRPAVAEPPRVLTAVAPGSFSRQVVPHAEVAAARLGGALEVVTVVEPIVVRARAIGGPVLDVDTAATAKRVTAAEAFLSDVVAPVRSRGRAVETRILQSASVAAAILAEAERVQAALIAMMTHGRSALGRAVLGSVADKVVRATRRDVLLVRGR